MGFAAIASQAPELGRMFNLDVSPVACSRILDAAARSGVFSPNNGADAASSDNRRQHNALFPDRADRANHPLIPI